MRKLFMLVLSGALMMVPAFAHDGDAIIEGDPGYIVTISPVTIQPYAVVLSKELNISFDDEMMAARSIGEYHSSYANITIEGNINLYADMDFGQPLCKTNGTSGSEGNGKGYQMPTTMTLISNGWLSGRDLTEPRDIYQEEINNTQTTGNLPLAGAMQFKIRHGAWKNHTAGGTGGAYLQMRANVTRAGLNDPAGDYKQGVLNTSTDAVDLRPAHLTLSPEA